MCRKVVVKHSINGKFYHVSIHQIMEPCLVECHFVTCQCLCRLPHDPSHSLTIANIIRYKLIGNFTNLFVHVFTILVETRCFSKARYDLLIGNLYVETLFCLNNTHLDTLPSGHISIWTHFHLAHLYLAHLYQAHLCLAHLYLAHLYLAHLYMAHLIYGTAYGSGTLYIWHTYIWHTYIWHTYIWHTYIVAHCISGTSYV